MKSDIAKSDNSVEFYAEGYLHMRVNFPHGKADCRHCRFIRYREPLGLFQCLLTEEFIERYELDGRHIFCPISFDDTPF